MAKALEWLFAMQDRMSGPARAVENSLRAVNRALDSVNTAEKQRQLIETKDPIAKQRISLELQRDALMKVADAQNKLNEKSAAHGEFLADKGNNTKEMLGTILGIAAAAAAAAVAVAGIGVAMAGSAIHAASLKRDTLAAFTVLTGSKDEARGLYDQISAIADISPFETKDVGAMFRSLLGGGFDRAEIEKTLKGVFDVGAIIGGDQGQQQAQSIIQQMLQVRSIGKLAYEDLKQISQASGGLIPIDKVAAQLAQVRHVTQAEAMKMISSGAITAQEGQAAILAVIQKTADNGKDLGTASKAFGTASLSGQLSTLKSRAAKIFEDVDIEPIIKVIDTINTFLASPYGNELKKGFTDTFSSIFQYLGGLLNGESLERWFLAGGRALDTLGKVWDVVMSIAKPFWEGLKSGLEIAWSVATTVFSAISSAMASIFGGGGGDAIIEGLQILAKVLGYVAAAAIVVLGIGALMLSAIGDLVGVVLGLSAALVSAGVNLIDGLWEGIKSGWANLVANFEGLVQLLPDTVKKVLGIASPSKVMAGLAVNTVEGFTNVIDRSAPSVIDSVSNVFNPATFDMPAINSPSLGSEAPAMGLSSSNEGGEETRRRGGSSTGDVEINIYIDGAGGQDAKDLGDQVAQRVREEMAKIMSGNATEQGAF